MNRATLAKWWGVIPATLSAPGVTTYDVQVMSEFRDRVVEAEAELQRKLKYGYAIDNNARRHGGPRPGDVIENDKGSGW